MNQEQYSELTKKASPNSKSYINIPKAFVFGGAICIIGELLLKMYAYFGFDDIAAGAWTSITLVAASALLTGLNWYQKMAKHGGAGTLVPITGFANAVVSPAMEFRAEGWVTGLGVKIFTIAGPVILYGAAASFIYGLIYYFFG